MKEHDIDSCIGTKATPNNDGKLKKHMRSIAFWRRVNTALESKWATIKFI